MDQVHNSICDVITELHNWLLCILLLSYSLSVLSLSMLSKQDVKILIVWIFWLHSIETDDGQTLNWDMYHLYFNKNLLWEIASDAFGPNWDCRKESRYVSFLFLTKTFSEKSFQTLSDRIETVGKNRFLPFLWIFILLMNYFGKNHLWEIVSDAFWPNLVCRKESFPTFIIQEQIFILHI